MTKQLPPMPSLDSILSILFEGIRHRWPQINRQQYDRVAEIVLTELGDRQPTIAELSMRLDEALKARFAPRPT